MKAVTENKYSKILSGRQLRQMFPVIRYQNTNDGFTVGNVLG